MFCNRINYSATNATQIPKYQLLKTDKMFLIHLKKFLNYKYRRVLLKTMPVNYTFSRFRERSYFKTINQLLINIQEKVNYRSMGVKPPSLFKNRIQKKNLILLIVKEPLNCFQFRKMDATKFIIRYKKLMADSCLKAEYTIVFNSIDESIQDFEMDLVSCKDDQDDNLQESRFISDIAFTQESM